MTRTRGYSTIFKGLAGLNNKVAAMRAPYDRENGIQAVTASENIIFDETGSARLRPGFLPVSGLDWSAVFEHQGVVLGVSGGTLLRIDVHDDSIVTAPLASGFSRRPEYIRVNDAIYYTAGEKRGRVVEGLHFPWNEPNGYGRNTDRVLSGPPAANHGAFHLARIWLGNDEGIVFSEPLGFGLFDLHQSSIPTDVPVTMMCAVKDGLFFSTTKKVYFLAGNTPSEFEVIEKDATPAKEWSLLPHLVPASRLGFDFSGDVALWVGQDGVYAGMPGGDVKNLTEGSVEFPETMPFGASVLFKDQFMFCLGG